MFTTAKYVPHGKVTGPPYLPRVSQHTEHRGVALAFMLQICYSYTVKVQAHSTPVDTTALQQTIGLNAAQLAGCHHENALDAL